MSTDDPRRPRIYPGQIVLVKPRPSQQPEATYVPVQISGVLPNGSFVCRMLPDNEMEAVRQAEIKALRKLEAKRDRMERASRTAGEQHDAQQAAAEAQAAEEAEAIRRATTTPESEPAPAPPESEPAVALDPPPSEAPAPSEAVAAEPPKRRGGRA